MMLRLFAAAMALAAAAEPPSVASNRTGRVVIFKHGRTGSTWMADLLKRQPAVGFFEHEANGCLKQLSALSNYRAMLSIVAAPTCDMRCENHVKVAAKLGPELLPWVQPLPATFAEAPACFAGKLVGFDVQPSKDYPAFPGEPTTLTWEAHWAPLVRTPRVSPVLYVRSNLIKHHVSKVRAKLLVEFCDTHKVFAGSGYEECYEKHREELHGPVAQNATTISQTTYFLAKEWRRLLESLHAAHGGRRFLILYYEQFQSDPFGAIGDLFQYAGLPRGAVVGETDARDVKLSSDDLRQNIRDFSRVEEDMAKVNPCLLPQLRDAGHTVFPELCLKAKDKRMSFDDYQVKL